MSVILVPTLYVMSGVCAFAALHHGLAVMRRRVNRVHFLFAMLSLSIMVLILAKVGAYQAQTVETLVALRKGEISAVCFFFALFPWFVAEYTDVRPRKFLVGLTVFWALLFTIDLGLPYGVQYADLPDLSYFDLPWGERVVDLRVIQPSIWNKIGWLGILVAMAFGFYACFVQYRRGQKKRARALAWALGLFFCFVLFNLAVNREIIRFVHMSDFGFISILVMMDMEIMLESRDQKRRMRAVLDHLPSAICLKDLQGRIQLINRGFEAFFMSATPTSWARPIQTCSPGNRPSASAQMKNVRLRHARKSRTSTSWNGTARSASIRHTSFRCCVRMARPMQCAACMTTLPNPGTRMNCCTSFAGRSGTLTAWRARAPSPVRSPMRSASHCPPSSTMPRRACVSWPRTGSTSRKCARFLRTSCMTTSAPGP